MPFNEDVQLDTSQVEDRRGVRAGPAIAVGGGGLGLILTLVMILLGGNPFDQGGGGSITLPSGPLGGLSGQSTDGDPSTINTTIASDCRTGADANAREDCRIVGYVNSVQKYWSDEFARRGSRYQLAKTTFFSGGTNTGCGAASSEVGPFYCPNDKYVYIDLGFFQELQQRFGAKGGPFAQGYVLAHEYGHHVQDLIGTLRYAQDRTTGPQSNGVRVELQADCLAGVWARNAVATGYLTEVSDAEVRDALDAAAAVGDDRIQKTVQGRVNKESWTHGSSEQRQRWFRTGYQSGNMDSCDTFKGQV